MRLVYSESALADLVRLRAFIAASEPQVASRIATELITRINSLCLFPEMGRAVELAPDPQAIRDAIFGKYIVRYLSHNKTVVILRIWHHYEDRDSST